MSLLGIDIGTTGCKSVLFSEEGELLAAAYEEYDIQFPQPGWAVLDSAAVWENIQQTIRAVTPQAAADSIKAVSATSCGEAMVPVSRDREILGPSITMLDLRGSEYVDQLQTRLEPTAFYRLNGNTFGNHYSLTKLMWLRDHQPDLYAKTHKFLLWGGFVPFMLGAEPFTDYSLANRTLLFDLEQETWSDEMLELTGLDLAKLPKPVPSGTVVGTVAPAIAAELSLPPNIPIVAGAHDQSANAVGCGVLDEGMAMYGMGTFLCIVPVFRERKDPAVMLARGLNTEHHAAPGKFVSFIYNDGGSLFKWFRETFAQADKKLAEAAGRDVYADLIAEMPDTPTQIVVLPHFSTTGPPQFIADSCGFMAGLRLDTSRGDILKGILQGATFYLLESVNSLPAAGIEISDFRAVGGGSKSDAWVQLSADILGRPFIRPNITEAGALGTAIMAGTGCGVFDSFAEGVDTMVTLEKTFEPNPQRQAQYREQFATYQKAWPLLQDYLREIATE
ncbi:hypothetical protein GF339_04730 [candidate division KSB3 bacterium]|uniref:Carbohydrate kinase n=1 Tax=candidate division KSB3 bacterium TaxID=2044937 RepID=A0A9D5Q4S7_9BACT|nr:hypothetical protein [candidate division KSB3 bacterium]MBD3323865.1 hypothetical protein [candidate division KSB3 bacterium]